MLKRLKDMPDGVDGLDATGTVTREDYDTVVLPLLEAARREGRRVRLLARFGPEFAGISPRGAWEGARVGVHHLRRFERCAVLSDNSGVRLATEVKASLSFLLSCSIKVFHDAERTAALQFLTAPDDRAPMPHRIVPGAGVLVLEPQGPLREEDFEAAAAEADPWIEAHGSLNGIVIQAQAFPGWEDIGAMIGHLRFVRDHQQKVRRVALAVDSPLADVAQQLASHFLAAEVKHFRYGDVVEALAWAEQGADGSSRATGRSSTSSSATAAPTP